MSAQGKAQAQSRLPRMLSFAVLREFSELELSGTLQTEAFIAPTGDTQAGALGSSRMFVVVVHGAVLFRSSLPRPVSLARNFSGNLNCGTLSFDPAGHPILPARTVDSPSAYRYFHWHCTALFKMALQRRE